MSEVVVTRSGSIGTVRLNRPDRANSVTPEVVLELGTSVGELMDDPKVDAVVFTGTGNAFCAGADVKAMWSVFDGNGIDHLVDYLVETWMPSVQTAIRALWAAPKPIVAAINGAAAAGGLDFALACDARVAVPAARFAESYINLGMVPVGGGAHLVSTIVGSARAFDLVVTGRLVSSEEALQLGLIDRVAAPEELLAVAAQQATLLSTATGAAVTEAKRLVRAREREAWESALKDSLAANTRLLAQSPVRDSLTKVMTDFGEKLRA